MATIETNRALACLMANIVHHVDHEMTNPYISLVHMAELVMSIRPAAQAGEFDEAMQRMVSALIEQINQGLQCPDEKDLTVVLRQLSKTAALNESLLRKKVRKLRTAVTA
jgi:hypothetical protein